MRPWDLETGASQLRREMESLQLQWQQANEVWDDAVSQNFCEVHLEPIGPAMKMALDAMGRMQQLVRQIHQDCEH